MDNYLKSNTYEFEDPFTVVDGMLAGTRPIDTDSLQMVIDLLRPLDKDNEIELAVAKLSAVLEQRMKINEVEDEKK